MNISRFLESREGKFIINKKRLIKNNVNFAVFITMSDDYGYSCEINEHSGDFIFRRKLPKLKRIYISFIGRDFSQFIDVEPDTKTTLKELFKHNAGILVPANLQNEYINDPSKFINKHYTYSIDKIPLKIYIGNKKIVIAYTLQRAIKLSNDSTVTEYGIYNGDIGYEQIINGDMTW